MGVTNRAIAQNDRCTIGGSRHDRDACRIESIKRHCIVRQYVDIDRATFAHCCGIGLSHRWVVHRCDRYANGRRNRNVAVGVSDRVSERIACGVRSVVLVADLAVSKRSHRAVCRLCGNDDTRWTQRPARSSVVCDKIHRALSTSGESQTIVAGDRFSLDRYRDSRDIR